MTMWNDKWIPTSMAIKVFDVSEDSLSVNRHMDKEFSEIFYRESPPESKLRHGERFEVNIGFLLYRSEVRHKIWIAATDAYYALREFGNERQQVLLVHKIYESDSSATKWQTYITNSLFNRVDDMSLLVHTISENLVRYLTAAIKILKEMYARYDRTEADYYVSDSVIDEWIVLVGIARNSGIFRYRPDVGENNGNAKRLRLQAS